MHKSNNKVQLIGNLGKDPKIIQLHNGTSLAKLEIAINNAYETQSGEKIKKTQWYTLSAWNKLAEVVKNKFKKGQEIKVEGSLNTRTYLDKAGIVRHITEVNCHRIELNRA
ncbi:single-stranded DNA-binding protein [Parvicella tangerina]|uniref:Single-stranded DNA-binding protein n=1 Tax=Parvicella tangerina TaxID=2829795 RepID=A0A916JPU5_9FLAO|nr:single-stranded DNA-binding protein [Parvicella tangerina]CAG5084781.1 Single-stranded DNA-binding protein [Parvicella tangerina]